MNSKSLLLWLGDLVIFVLVALFPGIRGYSNWSIGEYILLAFILGYILYLRHKNPAKTNVQK